MRRFLLAGVLAALVAGCNGGYNSSTPTSTTTAAPTASPTVSPVPTATPVPLKSENYFPITNQAAYDGINSGGGNDNFGKSPLVNGAIGTSCSSSLGTFGDYWVHVGPSIIPANDLAVNDLYGEALISKNAAGDVYVVGFTNQSGTTETCVQPYPIAKAQMVKGTGWTFVDIAGVSRTAVVVSDHTTATFTAPAFGGPVSTTYTGVVSQVSYGSDMTIFWAAGYGPVQTVNPSPPAGSAGPIAIERTLTARDWTLDPASK
jgi:hypothetical protein